MQAGLPVLACTDPNTDIGKTITDGGFGWWCESNNTENIVNLIESIISIDCSIMSENAKEYLLKNYSNTIVVNHISQTIAYLQSNNDKE